jgi:hypothetical protein
MLLGWKEHNPWGRVERGGEEAEVMDEQFGFGWRGGDHEQRSSESMGQAGQE